MLQVTVIAEMGTGETLMAMAIAHVYAAGRPYGCLFVVPPQLLQKTAREILQTIPAAKVYVIDSLRSQRPGQTGPQGVNELRLRNGRIVRDGGAHQPYGHAVARKVPLGMGSVVRRCAINDNLAASKA